MGRVGGRAGGVGRWMGAALQPTSAAGDGEALGLQRRKRYAK